MDCPNCGAPTKVVDSRPSAKTVVRRRKCLECKYRFSTIEIDTEVYERLSPPDVEAIRSAINDHLLGMKHSLFQAFKVCK